MVVIGSLSMVGDGGRRGGVGRALGGRWRVVRVGAGSLIYIIILAGTRNNVAVIISFYRACLFNLCSVTTCTQNRTATG